MLLGYGYQPDSTQHDVVSDDRAANFRQLFGGSFLNRRVIGGIVAGVLYNFSFAIGDDPAVQITGIAVPTFFFDAYPFLESTGSGNHDQIFIDNDRIQFDDSGNRFGKDLCIRLDSFQFGIFFDVYRHIVLAMDKILIVILKSYF